MKLSELINKDITVEYVNGEVNNKIVGELVEIDEDLKVIHLHTYYNNTNHLIPLYSVLSIKEKF